MHGADRVSSAMGSRSVRTMAGRLRRWPRIGSMPATARVKRDGENDHLADWWAEFQDPVLDRLIQQSYQGNLTLREAGFRILAARAQLGFAVGSFFPQLQTADGAYTRFGSGRTRSSTSGTSASIWLGSWISGAGSGGRFGRRMQRSTPRSKTTTPCWSRCWATWRATTSATARPRSGCGCWRTSSRCRRTCWNSSTSSSTRVRSR